MSGKFDLSTISTLIEWLDKYDEVELLQQHRESVEKFLKENFCDQKLFVDKTLEKKIFENVCRHRSLVETLLKSSSLEIDSSLIVHLFLMIFFMSKSTSATIYESMQTNFSSDVVKILMNLIDGEHFAKAVEQGGDVEFDKETLRGCLHEIRNLRKSMMETAANPKCATKSTLCSSTRTTLFTRPKKSQKKCTNDSDESENKLERILMNLPKKPPKKVQVLEFKNNAASILRAGAVVKNKLKSNDSVIEEIVAGSVDPLTVSNKIKKIIEHAHIKAIQEIERKHLMGLMSLEEAKIAKLEAVENNHMIADEIKRDRQKFLDLLRREQEQQIDKSKRNIRKIHLGRLMAKKNQFDVIVKKKMSADDVRKMNEKLQKEMNDAREKELQRKMEVIKQMSKDDKTKRISTEVCRKISTLKHSLVNYRESLELQQQQRKAKIQKQREHQKQLLAHASNLIEIHQKFRASKAEKVKHDIKPTPDLEALRLKLVQMRQMTSQS